MRLMVVVVVAAIVAIGSGGGAAWADEPAGKPVRIAAAAPAQATEPTRLKVQQDAMRALSFLDGEWRGTSKTLRKTGWASMTQTVRAGAMLGGAMRVIEVRSYGADGAPGFEALRVITYDARKKAYVMRSHQGGGVSEYAVEAKPGGIAWTAEARGGVKVRYEVSIRNGMWSESATRSPAQGKAETYLAVTMKRTRAGAWAEADATAAK